MRILVGVVSGLNDLPSPRPEEARNPNYLGIVCSIGTLWTDVSYAQDPGYLEDAANRGKFNNLIGIFSGIVDHIKSLIEQTHVIVESEAEVRWWHPDSPRQFTANVPCWTHRVVDLLDPGLRVINKSHDYSFIAYGMLEPAAHPNPPRLTAVEAEAEARSHRHRFVRHEMELLAIPTFESILDQWRQILQPPPPPPPPPPRHGDKVIPGWLSVLLGD